MKREDLLAPSEYNIVNEFEKFASEKDKLAVIWEDQEGLRKNITYATLLSKANQVANAMKAKGLKKGDKVLIIMPRLIESYIIYTAILKLGMVIIPSSEMLRKKDLEYRILHGEVKAIVSYFPFTDQFASIDAAQNLIKLSVDGSNDEWEALFNLAEQESDSFEKVQTLESDMAFLSYTSGTTGNPKAVVHTHGWGYAHLRTSAPHWLGIQEDDVVWATAAPGWQKWVWTPLLAILGSGATGFVYQGRFQAEKYLELIQENQVNVLCCTPTEYRIMAKVENLNAYHLSSLHDAVSAGEPLNREVIDTFERHFNLTVRDGYGQTESTLLVGTTKDMEIKPGSMGKPTPGNRVEIITDEGQPTKVGEVGNIAVHKTTPALFKEYYKDPERTAAQYVGDYFLTGDRASRDEDGYFWFEGRNDDIIISSGYTIGPFEVEDALVKHPKVKECAVVAKPDEIRGNIVKAYVILQNDEMKNEPGLVRDLQNFVKENTAPYKYPREIEFVSDLPKTTSGKIRRVELREKELNK